MKNSWWMIANKGDGKLVSPTIARILIRNDCEMKQPVRLIWMGAIGLLILSAGVVAFSLISPRKNGSATTLTIPDLSDAAQKGRIAFDANCASCHGTNGSGTQKGPPFVHDIYNPGHHGDKAFFLAVRQGVQRHHWSFGDMPPQPHVTVEDVAAIVRYIREMQEANGVVYRPHTM